MRITTERPEAMSDESFDLAVACLGYETRAVRVSDVFFRRSKRRICVGFDKNHIHNYAKNLDHFSAGGFEMHLNVSDIAFEPTVNSLLLDGLQISDLGSHSKIAVDISCFDRFRLAVLVGLLWRCVLEGRIGEVIFLYNIAKYTVPEDRFTFNTKLHPVHPSFVGSRPDPLAATVAIIGLGYEKEKAVGAAEYLEASDVFAFRPRSAVREYIDSVSNANALLLGQLDSRHQFVYEVEDCASLVSDLSSLVRGFVHRSSVLLVPLGPKVFALGCLLTAMIHERVAVWRMSQMGAGYTPDRLPSDNYSVVRLRA